MEKKRKWQLIAAIGSLLAFALWTVLVCLVDVRSIGPCGSAVGFATLNAFAHELTGVHMSLYIITDWLGLVPIAVAFGFAILGLAQWVSRKSILKVDRSILILGVFYLVVMACYFLFEFVVINHRPVLINGMLEASYPSSTTMLVLCVMPTAAIQLHKRIQHVAAGRCAVLAIAFFILVMVIGRLLSGVHWLTDIVGGVLFSAGLVGLYCFFSFDELERP